MGHRAQTIHLLEEDGEILEWTGVGVGIEELELLVQLLLQSINRLFSALFLHSHFCDR